MVVEIKAHCLYSRQDLLDMLAPLGIDADTFVARIKARKVFRQAWLGQDILDAFRAAPALSERDDAPELPAARNQGNQKRRRKTPADDPLEPLNRLLRQS